MLFQPSITSRSNIAYSTPYSKFVGGHEGTHGILDRLSLENTGTPALPYYVANPNHLVFLKKPGLLEYFKKAEINSSNEIGRFAHGAYPEETMANHVGLYSAGNGNMNQNWGRLFNKDPFFGGKKSWDVYNKELEGLPNAEGSSIFVDEYTNYLSDPHNYFP